MNNLTIILTSGVVASLVTSIIAFINTNNTNKRLIQIEKIKKDNSIQTFRYTKLFEINEELNNLPDIDYTFLSNKNGKLIQDKNKLAKVIGQSTERFSKFEKIYYKSKPLIDEEFIIEPSKLIELEKTESNNIVESLYTGKSDNDISELMNIRNKLEEKLKNSISHQLRKLIS